ncbi:MAG: O-antigen ligase [Cyclobacteriaceae bacterium]
MNRVVNINFNKLLYQLLCGYALLIPLDSILEVFFDIETVFKPYRIFALLIVGVFALKTIYKWDSNKDLKKDVYLYIVFAIGLIVTLYRMITTRFYMNYFINDSFQLVLYLAVFFVIRHIDLTKSRALSIFRFLVTGIILNGVYSFYTFNILRYYGRVSGFMDNPNQLALTFIFAIVFAITIIPELKKLTHKILWLVVILFSGYLIIISGSRTALLILVILSAVIMFFSSFKIKFGLVIIGVFIVIFLGILRSADFYDRGPLILLNRVTNKQTSDDPRWALWEGVIEASQQTNFIGLGIGQYKGRFSEFYYDSNNGLIKKMINKGYFLSTHSDFFGLLVIYGIFGLLSYLFFLMFSAKQILYEYYGSSDEKSKLFRQLLLLSLVSIVTFSLTAENFNFPFYWIVLSLSTKTYIN